VSAKLLEELYEALVAEERSELFQEQGVLQVTARHLRLTRRSVGWQTLVVPAWNKA
jgi:hypothetical protein